MFAAISGLKTHQVMLDVTSNDIANVNTIGYKSARTTFKDSLTQLQRGASGPGGGTGGSNAAQIGLGTQLGSIDNLMQSGALQSTGNPLDVAIQGPGFFRVAASPTAAPAPNPTATEYTRAGNFTTTSLGYLVTQDGYYIQGHDAGGADIVINIPPGSTNVAIGQDGDVSYVDGTGTRQSAGFITLATFSNSAGLQRSGANRWLETTNSGVGQVGTPGAQFGFTTAGAVEMSNVDLAQSFTNMITAQRGFQANSRVISTSDEMLSDLVNLKR
ncbi:MAG TPA: flagellar hook-basal body complex protein [Acidimicrobiales bacterium]